MEIAAVFGLNWKLLLIQAVNFGIVLFLLQRFLYKPILRIIDERRLKIQKGLSDAEQAAARLAAAEKESKAAIAEAAAHSRQMVERAEASAKAKEAEILKEAAVKVRRQEEEALREAELLKQQTIEESREEIARLAVLAAEKVLSGVK